jgi:hypothetical protein
MHCPSSEHLAQIAAQVKGGGVKIENQIDEVYERILK